MIRTGRVSRRTMLRGLGAAVSLPLLESMTPFASAAATKSPVRLAFCYIPNGVNQEGWNPKTEGFHFDLPNTLSPLRPLRDDLMVLSGLTHDKGRANDDGAGDHARAASTFLTGAQPVKTHGADIRVGVSADQIAAMQIGNRTRLPSLEIGCDQPANSGNCDSGYSCAYSCNISWRTPSTPMAKEHDPKAVFDRLFGSGDSSTSEGVARREAYQKSILDFVLEDTRRLNAKVSGSDKRKLDEYFTSIRDIEQRIARSDKSSVATPTMARPGGIPNDFREHLRLMADLLVLAFQTDTTRIATFMFARDGSNRSYPQVGVPDGHHELSHHQRDAAKLAKIQRIDQFHIEQFAYMLQRLKAHREGDRSLLDNCAVVLGSGIGDGDRHNHDNLPVLVAGRAGGAFLPGRHVRFAQETPMCNLFVSMLNTAGARVDSFGDSTGRLPFLGG